MSTQCRFCGGKVFADATDCKHCGKVLSKKATTEQEERGGLTNLNSWDKSIPSWVMYLVCGFFLFCLILLFVKGCQGTQEAPNPDEPATAKASEDTLQRFNLIIDLDHLYTCPNANFYLKFENSQAKS